MRKYAAIMLVVVLLITLASPAFAKAPVRYKFEERSGHAVWQQGEWGDEEIVWTDLWMYQADKDTIHLYLYQEKLTWVPYEEPICYVEEYDGEVYEWCEEGDYDYEVLLNEFFEIPATDFLTTQNFKKGAVLDTLTDAGRIHVTWDKPYGFSSYKGKGTFERDGFRFTYNSKGTSTYNDVHGHILGEDMGTGWGGLGNYSSIDRIKSNYEW